MASVADNASKQELTRSMFDPRLVSVIIPTYNRQELLPRAVDSVLAQDYPHVEIIVVDDGSTDRTPEILNGYGDRIRVIRQPNQGVSSARNKGILSSGGAFIALLDSDDAWKPGKLSCQTAFFNAHPGAMICQTEEIWIRNGRRVNPRAKHKKPSGMIFDASLHLCLVSPSAVMMRRELFDIKGLFKTDFPVCEDYDLWLRVSRDTAVFLIDAPMTVKYGGHGDQLSARSSQDKYRIRAITDLLASGTLSSEQAAAAGAVVAKKALIYANGCRKRGRIGEADRYLALSARFSAG